MRRGHPPMRNPMETKPRVGALDSQRGTLPPIPSQKRPLAILVAWLPRRSGIYTLTSAYGPKVYPLQAFGVISMGQYVLNENEGKYLFNLCASNGHIVATSMVFPSKDDCLDGINRIRKTAKDAAVEDTTSLDWQPVAAPKYRIFQTLSGNYFFRFYPDESNDIAQSHSYPHKDSLLRRIERMRAEGDSPLAQSEE